MAVEQRWSKAGCESSWKNAGGRSTAGDFERELASYGSRSSSAPRKGSACALILLIILATAAAIASSVSLYLDNFVGASEPGRTVDLPYPRLEDKVMSRLIFNDSIPNTVGIFHKYIDLRQSVDSKTVTVRKGVLSQCDKPLATPAVVRYVESPWSPRTCTPDGVRTFFCPVVVVRLGPGLPEVISGSAASDGCFTREQRCNGILDCPSGHDEMGCTAGRPPSCPTGASPCPDKNICVNDSQLCDGLNDCGMYEDESNCCGVDGFIRCNDGHCVAGSRCDGHAECIDLSDEYNCPMPSDDTYFQCDDGQLIEGRHVCDAGSATLQPYQCRDLSDETDCSSPSRFTHRRATSSSATFDRGAGCFLSRNFRCDSESFTAGSHRSSAAAGAGYESGMVAVLAAFAASLACSWVACLLAWLSCASSLRRRRPVATARLYLLVAGLLFLCAAAQCAVVAYWCLYAGDVNRELHNAKQPSPLGQVFRETLLALGVELRLRTSLVLTATAAALHLTCVVLSLIARRSRLRQLDSAMASFITESDAASVQGRSAKNEKKKKQKMMPLLNISTAYHRNSFSDDVGEATPTLCIRSLRQDVKCPFAAGGENDGDEQRSLPEKESLDSSHWMDVDKEKLRAILDHGDATSAVAAAAADGNEQEAAPLLLPPSACVGRQFFDVFKAAASDTTAACGSDSCQSGPPPLLLQRLSKSRAAAVLPCVQESECEAVEDQYVNFARQSDGAQYCHGDASSSRSAHRDNAIEPGDAVAAAPQEVGVYRADYGSRLRIGAEKVEVGGAIGQHLLGCSSVEGATPAVGLAAAEVVATGSPSEVGSAVGDNSGGGRRDSGPAVTSHGLPAAGSAAQKPRATGAADARLNGDPEPLMGTPKSSCSAAPQPAADAGAIVGSSGDNVADEGDGDGNETSSKVINVLDKTKESVSAFAAPQSGHLARAGR